MQASGVDDSQTCVCTCCAFWKASRARPATLGTHWCRCAVRVSRAKAPAVAVVRSFTKGADK